MTDELKFCMQILEEAIKFEKEGMDFFQERGKSAPSAIERSVFASLAADEAGHHADLIKMRDEMLARNDVSAIKMDDDHHRAAREIFTGAMASVADSDPYSADELEILRGALEVERRGFNMYKKAAAGVTSASAKETFEHLASQEQEHFRLLSNTLDYLSNPEGFHGFDESPMLDGG